MIIQMNASDRLRAGILLAAVIGVFAFAAWRVNGVLSSRGEAQTVGNSTTVSTPAPTAATPQSAALIRAPAAPALDPFRTTVSQTELPPKAAPGQTPTTPTGKIPNAPAGHVVERPPVMGGNIPVNIAPLGVNVGSGVLPSPAISIRLIGTISGLNPVAIVEVLGKEQVVSIGDRLASGETISQITGDSVTLSRDGKKTVLRAEGGEAADSVSPLPSQDKEAPAKPERRVRHVSAVPLKPAVPAIEEQTQKSPAPDQQKTVAAKIDTKPPAPSIGDVKKPVPEPSTSKEINVKQGMAANIVSARQANAPVKKEDDSPQPTQTARQESSPAKEETPSTPPSHRSHSPRFAVIQINGHEHVAKAGDYLEAGQTLAQVSEDRVVITKGDDKIVLLLDSHGNTSEPGSPPDGVLLAVVGLVSDEHTCPVDDEADGKKIDQLSEDTVAINTYGERTILRINRARMATPSKETPSLAVWLAQRDSSLLLDRCRQKPGSSPPSV